MSNPLFLAFTGKPANLAEKIFPIRDGYECWDLEKFALEEFVDELKRKVPPINNNVLRHYSADTGTGDATGITEDQFKRCSWGLLLPDARKGYASHQESLFLLNIYSPRFLYPVFCANEMGIERQGHDQNPARYFHDQDHSIFCTKEFVTFHEHLSEQGQYAVWDRGRAEIWNKEDWRLFVAAKLYNGLQDYENSKSPFEWQRESAEMATVLEALFTAGDAQNEEVIYRLRKRVATLLYWKFPEVEKDIKELYKARSAFVHGSFFLEMAKRDPATLGDIPSPDFNVLYKQKEYVRFALVAYLNLAKAFRSGHIGVNSNVMRALEESIVDIGLREKLRTETAALLTLMPEPNFKRL